MFPRINLFRKGLDTGNLVGYNPCMMNPDNHLPEDWDLDMQYEDRYACLGDAEWENTPDYDEEW